jgi:formate hydrogenlyase subunit 4
MRAVHNGMTMTRKGGVLMALHSWLLGLLYAVAALLLAAVVIVPIFIVVNIIYHAAHGLTLLLVVTVLVWVMFAWLLRRRRISL